MRVTLWLKNSLVYALASMAGAMGYALMMFLMDPAFELPRLVDMASGYLLGIGVVMAAIVAIADYKTTLPLALSLGSTRKEALLGMQLGRLVYVLVLLAASAGMFAVNGGWELLWVIVPVIACVLLVMSALGAVMGMVVVRFGKACGVIVGVLIGLLTAGCVFAAITLSNQGWTVSGSGWLWLLPAIGAAVWGAVLLIEHRTVYNYNVKL